MRSFVMNVRAKISRRRRRASRLFLVTSAKSAPVRTIVHHRRFCSDVDVKRKRSARIAYARVAHSHSMRVE